MRRSVQILLVLSLSLNIGFALAWLGNREGLFGFGDAQRHAFDRPPRMHGAWASHRARWLDRRLHLDPKRRDALRSSLLDLEPEMETTRNALRSARREFGRQLRQPVPNRDSVLTTRDNISVLQARLDSLVTEALLREAKVLRPEERRRRPEDWFPHPRGMRQGERR
jgi:Spy/CpxP family protein refolding chaperone